MSLKYFDVTGAPYFAKGDGTTDDTDAIQNALNAADDNPGSTVFIPDGTYLVAGTDTTPALTFAGSDSTITGNGTIKLDGNGDAVCALELTAVAQRNVISGIQIDGNDPGRPGGDAQGLRVLGDYNIVRDVRIHNLADTGITGRQCMEVTGNHNLIESCWLEDGVDDAVLDKGDYNTYRNVVFRNFKDNGLHHAGNDKTRIDLHRCYFASDSSASEVVPIKLAAVTNPLKSAYLSDCVVEGLENAGTTNTRCASFSDVNLLVIENCQFLHNDAFDTIRFDGNVKVARLVLVSVSRTLQGKSSGQRFERFVLDNCVIGDGTHAPTYSFEDLDAENFVARDCRFVDFTSSALSWLTAAANYHHLEATNCLFHGKAASAITYDIKVAGSGAVNASGNILWRNNVRENPETGGSALSTDNTERRFLFTTRDSSKKVFEGTAAPADVDVTWAAGDLVYDTAPGAGAREVGWVYIGGTDWKRFGDIDS